MGALEAVLVGAFVVCVVIWLVRLMVQPRPKPPTTLHGSTIDALTDPANSAKPPAPEAFGIGTEPHLPTPHDDLEEGDG